MKQLLKDIYQFFPVQLLILHFRKYQILLVFWLVLFSILDSNFMQYFGADALFFSPEYLGSVNIFSALFTGIALGVYIMSWNITSFILHSHRFRFLATTSNLFLKYCINNSIIPLFFLVYYFIKLYHFNIHKELMPVSETVILILGIFIGYVLSILISFAYFFGTGKTIERSMATIISNPQRFAQTFTGQDMQHDQWALKVNYYLNTGMRLQKARDTRHYRQSFVETIFKRHHLAAIGSIFLAFVFLIIVGFFLENKYFVMPAAASILIFFGLLVGVIGALVYFLQSWSLVGAIVLLFLVNLFFKKDIVNFRNEAYGLTYPAKKSRPEYNKAALLQLSTPENMAADKRNMIQILENWKRKQKEDKPPIIFINVSGGGLRSAAFTMNMLQQIDSLTQGELMHRAFLITGASGGMLAATYYRELYRRQLTDTSMNIHAQHYADNITQDLLNPIFTSLISRDLFFPAHKFTWAGNEYIKDRGFAFEQQMNINTGKLMNVSLGETAKDEAAAKVPLLFFNAVVKADGRKMVISTQPVSFMMKTRREQNNRFASPDAIDFGALFSAQHAHQLRLLTAMRMNASFPYVLPTVWLPTEPAIDVMDAGLRDNFGQEMATRFLDNFSEWIHDNTSEVIILQLRDRLSDGWQNPIETNTFTELLTTPATMLQHNWHKMQDFGMSNQYNYFSKTDTAFYTKFNLEYISDSEDNAAALNFHLTGREKNDVIKSFNHERNQRVIRALLQKLKP